MEKQYRITCVTKHGLPQEMNIREVVFSGEIVKLEPLDDCNEELSASEALYGFVGWITTREQRICASSKDDCGKWAEIVDRFCKHNNLSEPRENWDKLLKQHPKDCPASECECESDDEYNAIVVDNTKCKIHSPKEPSESLEEKMQKYMFYGKVTKISKEELEEEIRNPLIINARGLAQIAKAHYQQNPEELELQEHWKHMYDGAIRKLENKWKGMVSKEEVLRVFDEEEKNLPRSYRVIGNKDFTVSIDLSTIRKAIENIGDKK